MRRGRRGPAVGGAGPLRRRLRRSLPDQGTGRSRPVRLVEATLAGLGLRLHPEKTRIVRSRRRGRGLRLLGVPPPDGAVLEAAGPLVAQQVAVTAGHGLDQGQGPGADRRRLRRPDAGNVVEDLNPVLRGWGAYFRYGNSSASSAPSTATSRTPGQAGQRKYGLHGAELARPIQLAWLADLGGLPAHRNGALPGLRMPDGERCRRAVCGRTACTVR